MSKPKINWIANDPKKYNWHTEGNRYLVAILVHNNKTKKTAYEFDVVKANCDGDNLYLEYKNGDPYDAWDWSSITYFHLLEGEMPTNGDPS